MSTTHTRLAGSILSVADLLRGDYEQSEYGKMILPSTVLRRPERMLKTVSKAAFYNTSKLDFVSAVRGQDYVGRNVRSSIGAFSENAGVRV